MKIDRNQTATKLISISNQLNEMAIHILTTDVQDYDINCAVGAIRARIEILSNKLQECINLSSTQPQN